MTTTNNLPNYDNWKLASPPAGEPEPEIIECFGCDATADVSDFAYPTAYLLEQGWRAEPQFKDEQTMYCPDCTAEIERESSTLVHFISAVAVMLIPALIISAAILLDNSDIAAIKGMLY